MQQIIHEGTSSRYIIVKTLSVQKQGNNIESYKREAKGKPSTFFNRNSKSKESIE
jgi:hypothetical protein